MLTAIVCRWSAEFGAKNYGSPDLHIMLAEYIYYESPEVVCIRITSSICPSVATAFEFVLYMLQLCFAFEKIHFYPKINKIFIPGPLTQNTSDMQDMARVTNHFVRGNNPKKFASVLVDFLGKVSLVISSIFSLLLYSHILFSVSMLLNL